MFRSKIFSAFQKAKTANQINNKIGSHCYNLRPGTRNGTVIKGMGVFGNNYSTKSNSDVITCKGAVCWGEGEPVRVEEIQVDPPKSTEVRLKMSYASLCHTDILCRNGVMGDLFPRVLGHEGVGVVESVGDQVTEFKEGDVVIPTFLGECHMCENCLSGKTNVCPTYPLPLSGLMPDGTSRMSCARSSKNERLYHLFSCSTWAEYSVIDVNYAVKVENNKLPLPHASLLSCGFSTGFGAPWKAAKVKKGSSVAVIGLGAVGLGAIEGARLQEASRIIGIDKNTRKSAIGKAFGMTEFINPGDDRPVSDLVKDVTDGQGVDYSIECSGALPLAQQALECTKPGTGTTVLIGAGSKPSTEIDYMTLLLGRTLKGCVFGGIKVKSELPILLDNCVTKVGEDYYIDNFKLRYKLITRIPKIGGGIVGIRLDELVTHEVSLDDIGKAFDLLKEPDCCKVLIKI